LDSARTRRTFAGVFLLLARSLLGGPESASAEAGEGVVCPTVLTRSIPPRPSAAPMGTHFAARVADRGGPDREATIEAELLRGNLPAFLRRLQPVALTAELPDGRRVTATICVMPDYLAIGANRDFLRVPMNLHTAVAVAGRFGFVLPTRKMVDAIYLQSAAHLRPQPMRAGPEMRSTDYYLRHDRSIGEQRRALGIPLGVLISGHKKDVVISNRLTSHPDRIAIYGWHELDGHPIQSLSTVHGANYADYSHGIRLVSDVVYIDGVPASLHDVLADPQLAVVLSDEGPVTGLSQLIPAPPALPPLLGLPPPGTSEHPRFAGATHSSPLGTFSSVLQQRKPR
jgi:hypothetical protein